MDKKDVTVSHLKHLLIALHNCNNYITLSKKQRILKYNNRYIKPTHEELQKYPEE